MHPSPAKPPPGSRVAIYAVSIACVAAVASPAAWDVRRDSFPLSTYPMFAQPRDATMSLTTVVGVRRDGQRVMLSPSLIAGSSWVNLAVRRVRDVTNAPPAAREALCEAVALRVASRGDASVEHVEVAREHFDTVAYFAEAPIPLSRETYARCPVRR